jgi:F-type H+-transporting ATPase subunit epsilon
MKTFKLKISSPEGDVFHGEIAQIIVRGTEGELAVMAGHIPFATAVRPCDCRILTAENETRIGHIDGGLLTVSADKTVLLCGSFVWQE